MTASSALKPVANTRTVSLSCTLGVLSHALEACHNKHSRRVIACLIEGVVCDLVVLEEEFLAGVLVSDIL